jgi:hypothetical protein
MKNQIISGGAVIIAGLLIAAGPQWLFAVCDPKADGSFMLCHWSARAEIGAGGLIAALGAALFCFSSPKIRLGLTIGVFLSGVLALLIPHWLIGGCAMHSMRCRTVSFPAITVTGILLLIVAALNMVYLARKMNRLDE